MASDRGRTTDAQRKAMREANNKAAPEAAKAASQQSKAVAKAERSVTGQAKAAEAAKKASQESKKLAQEKKAMREADNKAASEATKAANQQSKAVAKAERSATQQKRAAQAAKKASQESKEFAQKKKEKSVASQTRALPGDSRQSRPSEQRERPKAISDEYHSRATGRGLYQYYKKKNTEHKLDGRSGAIRPENYSTVRIMPNGDVFGSYKELKKILKEQDLSQTREKGSKQVGMEAHHLIEKRCLQSFGIKDDDGVSIAIYSDEHMKEVTKYIDDVLPKRETQDIWTVVDKHIEAYQKLERPEWIKPLKSFILENQTTILNAYENSNSPESLEKARRYLQSL